MQIFDQTDDKIENDIGAYLADFEQLPYGIAVVNSDPFATVIRANPAFYKIIRHTEEQFRENHKNSLIDILVDNLYSVVERKRALKQDYDFDLDIRIKTADDDVIWAHDFVHYNAKLDLFYITLVDVTDKLFTRGLSLSYEAFHTKNEILFYLSKHTSEHIVVTDVVTDEVVYMNASAMKLLHFSNEHDWLGKTYVDIIFGSVENIHPNYYNPASEDIFMAREYYNCFHKMHIHVEAKIISIPTLKRKMRLNIISDITAQKDLESKVALQKTLHNCVEALFTAAASYKVSKDAYYDVLNELKTYYQADGAFFYRFVDGTHEVERIYKVLSDGENRVEHVSPMVMTDEQIKLMQAVSAAETFDEQKFKNSYSKEFMDALVERHLQYHINDFTCVVINDIRGDIVAFMGVSNPRANADNKELMELLSRFIGMYMEHQRDDKLKEEAVKLEARSKARVIEKCGINFRNLGDPKKNIENTLDELCRHYDADCSVILSGCKMDHNYRVSYVGGQIIPDLTDFEQSAEIMEKWTEIFEKHPQFVSDAELDMPVIKAMLQQKYGMYNYIVSPIQDHKGDIIGLLFVNNYKLSNRSHLMVHVVAKNISDYLDRISMNEKTYLEPATQLANKVATQTRITRLLDDGNKGALFIIDIDNFKKLNDTLGHHVGDKALVDLAEILKKLFRTTDVIGRIGGDEFMVFSPGVISHELIVKKSNLILENSQLSYQKDGHTVDISVSIGACCVGDTSVTFQSLYEKADHALYVSKRAGKNQYYIDSLET